MRILIVGAGALGGYFGARLLQVGSDVTFLLRPRRAAELAHNGLQVFSPLGDVHVHHPPHVLAEHIHAPYDLIIVGCKAYDLPGTMDAFAPAVDAGTTILPLLNGMRHMELLADRFGEDKVLGGWCMISATLDAQGTVRHVNELHGLSFGECAGGRSARVDALEQAFARANFDARASEAIIHEMWEKWVFIAAAAGLTCLMRGSVGDVVAGGAAEIGEGMLREAGEIAARNGHAPRDAGMARSRTMLTTPGSPMTSSMMMDIERAAPTEGAHIIGDLLARGGDGDYPLLRVADAHLRTYAARRAREANAR